LRAGKIVGKRPVWVLSTLSIDSGENYPVTTDQPHLPNPDPRPFQFSLKTLLWITAYCCVLAQTCTALHRYWLKGLPVWLLVFFFTWTAGVLAQLAFSIWGYFWLRKMRAAGSAQTGGFTVGDLHGPDEPYERGRRFWAAFAWGAMALVLWMTFAATLVIQPSNQELMGLFGLIALHFLPLVLVSHLPYVFGSKRKTDPPLRAMRWSSITALVIPAVVLPAYWVLS